MNYTNAGNLLPFFDSLDWQRHRQLGQDALPYGLPASRIRLIPFQAFLGIGFDPDTIVFRLVNIATADTITLDDALIEVSKTADGKVWLTYQAADLDTVPDCGFWYVWLTVTDGVDTVQRYSEVMRLANWANFERARLTKSGCGLDGADLEISFFDTSPLVGTATSVTVEKRVGASWVGVGTGDFVLTVANADEGAIIRITVVSSTGNTLQTEYTLAWDSGDPCATLTVTESGQNDDLSDDLPDLWRVTFTNAQDRGNVLYQTGYIQELFLEPAPIWDVPEIERSTETVVNGEGLTITRTARTVERMRFESMDLPDYVIHFLTGAAELDTVTLENVTTGKTLTLENLAFTSRRQGKELNTGQFQADGRTEYFAGCDEDFVLV